MVYFIVIVCIASFVGGLVTEWKRQNHMTPSQQRQRQREHFQAAAGIITGVAVGTVTAAQTIVKKAGVCMSPVFYYLKKALCNIYLLPSVSLYFRFTAIFILF